MTNRQAVTLNNASHYRTTMGLSGVVRVRVQWWIQLWADKVAAPPPIDQNLGLVMAARNSLSQIRWQICI